MGQHVLHIGTSDESWSTEVVLNAGKRFQNEIFHDAHLVYPDKMYSNISPNTTVLPNCFRISVFSIEYLSPKPVPCLQWVMS